MSPLTRLTLHNFDADSAIALSYCVTLQPFVVTLTP